MTQSTILCTGKITEDEDLAPLRKAGYKVVVHPGALSTDDFISKIQGCSGLIHGGDEFLDKHILSSASELRAIAILATGYQSFIDVDSARSLQLVVSNTPGANSNAVAELAILQLLALKRRFLTNISSSTSQSSERESELFQSAVGIIGIGAIGIRVATILKNGFGAKVFYASRSRKLEVERDLGITYDSLEGLLSKVSSVVLCAPETAETRDLLNEANMQLIPLNSILVSIARPSLISSSALLAALHMNRLAGVAFDWFYPESDPNYSALHKFVPDRLIITPHIGYRTADACRRMSRMAVEAIIAGLAGERHPTRVF